MSRLGKADMGICCCAKGALCGAPSRREPFPPRPPPRRAHRGAPPFHLHWRAEFPAPASWMAIPDGRQMAGGVGPGGAGDPAQVVTTFLNFLTDSAWGESDKRSLKIWGPIWTDRPPSLYIGGLIYSEYPTGVLQIRALTGVWLFANGSHNIKQAGLTAFQQNLFRA